jgi:hypothetical protein
MIFSFVSGLKTRDFFATLPMIVSDQLVNPIPIKSGAEEDSARI